MLERIMLFWLGGAGYVSIELAWRGCTHWTMFAAGGVGLCLLHELSASNFSLPYAAAVGAGQVSILEYCTGMFCRGVLCLNVWDYGAEWGNLQGLVCPKYSVYWFVLCGWVIFVLRRLQVNPMLPKAKACR